MHTHTHNPTPPTRLHTHSVTHMQAFIFMSPALMWPHPLLLCDTNWLLTAWSALTSSYLCKNKKTDLINCTFNQPFWQQLFLCCLQLACYGFKLNQQLRNSLLFWFFKRGWCSFNKQQIDDQVTWPEEKKTASMQKAASAHTTDGEEKLVVKRTREHDRGRTGVQE